MQPDSHSPVLVVSHSAEQIELITTLLSSAGYRVVNATQGRPGLEAARRERPLLIIIAMLMPGGGSTELCGLLRVDSELSLTPILLVSGIHKDAASIISGLEAGADDYVEAPYQPAHFLAKVKRLIDRTKLEKALRRAEEKYRGIFENSIEGIFQSTTEGRFITVNPALARMLGYDSPAEVLASGIDLERHYYVDPEGRKKFKLLLNDCDVVRSYEGEIYRKDGSRIWTRENVRCVREESGEIIYYEGTVEDITDRKQAEAALRESEERTRLIIDSALDAVITMNAEGRITGWNLQAETSFGWSREEAVGRLLSTTIIPSQYRESHERGLKHFLSTGEGPVLNNRIEITALRRDGKEFPVELTVSATRLANEVVFGAFVRDISERKRAEEEVLDLLERDRQSEQRYRELVENAKDIIYTHDMEGRYLSVNRAAAETTGYTRDESLKMNIADVVAPEYLEKAREMTAAKAAGQPLSVYDLEIIAKDGRRVALEVNSWLIYRDNAPVGVQGIARDVTERKQLAQQLRQSQKLEAVGQLAGGVAHDFNNLLTVISGYSEIVLMRFKDDEFLTPKVTEIKKAADRAASLTRQLLAFSRKQVLEPKVLDLNDVVAEIDKLLRRLIGEDIDLITIRKPGLGSIKADPGQLSQVIVNLAVNSRDAMPNGGKLTIETDNVYLDEAYARNHIPVSPGQYVMVALSDTGEGMDAETQKQIFEPFFTTKEVGKGTGLGLSMAYGVVKQSGGYIWVYSEVGKGTTFKIYLPMVEGQVEHSADIAPELPKGTQTVLLVEDEEAVRELVRDILELQGYTVLGAHEGGEALQLCEQYDGPIHLIITDVVMPGMTGRELVEHVSSMRPETSVLYMSGYTDDAIVRHGVLEPGTNFLQKPFTPDALARKVHAVLSALPPS